MSSVLILFFIKFAANFLSLIAWLLMDGIIPVHYVHVRLVFCKVYNNVKGIQWFDCTQCTIVSKTKMELKRYGYSCQKCVVDLETDLATFRKPCSWSV